MSETLPFVGRRAGSQAICSGKGTRTAGLMDKFTDSDEAYEDSLEPWMFVFAPPVPLSFEARIRQRQICALDRWVVVSATTPRASGLIGEVNAGEEVWFEGRTPALAALFRALPKVERETRQSPSWTGSAGEKGALRAYVGKP